MPESFFDVSLHFTGSVADAKMIDAEFLAFFENLQKKCNLPIESVQYRFSEDSFAEEVDTSGIKLRAAANQVIIDGPASSDEPAT